MKDQTPTPTAVATLGEPPALAYATVKVISIVTVQQNAQGQEEISAQPPHLAAAVVVKDQPGAIVAFCGPASELGCVQDAVVLSQAYALRKALLGLVKPVIAIGDLASQNPALVDALKAAQEVLDAADPQFMRLDKPSAEEQLAEARKDYDPELNASTADIIRFPTKE